VDDPAADAQVNVVGTLRLARACADAGVKRFVFTSSGGAMFSDAVRPPYAETVPAAPMSPYGIAKRAAEMYLEFEREARGLRAVVLRLANVYGPRQAMSGPYSGVISKFCQHMVSGKPCVITGTGRQTRDYVYVGDVVRAHLLAAEKDVAGIYHVGTGRETSVVQIFKKLNKIMRAGQKEEYAPACPGEVMRSALDARKAAKELGWKPEVDLDEGLRKTAEWFGR
jgi:UDP-glucose 4-epimerase